MIKKNYLLLAILIIVYSPKLKSQTSLSAGDLAFVSMKVAGSGSDAFSFITFKDLCANTVIYFSDMPYRNTGGFCAFPQEFCVSLTVTTKIPAGTIVKYIDGTPGTCTMPAGAGTIAYAFATAANQNMGFSSSNDNIFAFQGTYASPTFIASLKTSAYTASGSVNCSNRAHTELPSGLTLGTNAVFKALGGNDVIKYTGTTSGTIAAIKSAIFNSANWTATSTDFSGTISLSNAVTATCTFLPVELTDFNATSENERVKLDWTTATEQNSDYFIVERSVNCIDFEPILKVAAAGFSNEEIHYEDFDVKPFYGINYYKLRQIDFDGQEAFFDIKSVNFQTNNAANFSVFPNPFENIFNVHFNIAESLTLKVEVSDNQGKIVYLSEFKALSGWNFYEINLSENSAGNYLCKLINTENLEVIGRSIVIKK